MKAIRFHARVLKDMQDLDMTLRLKIADFLALLASGESIGMPASRPMVSVGTGAHELRVKDHTVSTACFILRNIRKRSLFFICLKRKRRQHQKTKLK